MKSVRLLLGGLLLATQTGAQPGESGPRRPEDATAKTREEAPAKPEKPAAKSKRSIRKGAPALRELPGWLRLPAAFWTSPARAAALLLVRENVRLDGGGELPFELPSAERDVPAEGQLSLALSHDSDRLADGTHEERGCLLVRWSPTGARLYSTLDREIAPGAFALDASRVRQLLAVSDLLAGSRVLLPPPGSDEPTYVLVGAGFGKATICGEGAPAGWRLRVVGNMNAAGLGRWRRYLDHDPQADLRATLIYAVWAQALAEMLQKRQPGPLWPRTQKAQEAALRALLQDCAEVLQFPPEPPTLLFSARLASRLAWRPLPDRAELLREWEALAKAGAKHTDESGLLRAAIATARRRLELIGSPKSVAELVVRENEEDPDYRWASDWVQSLDGPQTGPVLLELVGRRKPSEMRIYDFQRLHSADPAAARTLAQSEKAAGRPDLANELARLSRR